MSVNHPTTSAASGKPAKPGKPYQEFPLTPHSWASGAKRFAAKALANAYLKAKQEAVDGGELMQRT